jgi:hypothetical protein
MSPHDQPDALSRGSQREEKKIRGRQKHEHDLGEKKPVFVTGTTAGMRYERARVLSARSTKENEYNDEYSD